MELPNRPLVPAILDAPRALRWRISRATCQPIGDTGRVVIDSLAFPTTFLNKINLHPADDHLVLPEPALEIGPQRAPALGDPAPPS